MELQRGIVVEVKDNSDVIVLTPRGDILEVKTNEKKHQIGDPILFYERIKNQEEKHWVRRSLRYVAGIAAALLFIFCTPLQLFDSSGENEKAYAKPDAHVYIESKSNVKLDVNKRHDVVNVEPLNTPAKRVLNRMHWEGEQVGEFVKDYFVVAKKTGYLGPEDKVIIVVAPVRSPEKDNTAEIIQEEISQDLFLKENGIKAIAVTVPNVVVKKADDLGITPGKFIISLIAKATGKEIPDDVLKVATITELVNTNPIVEKILPTYTVKRLTELVQNVFASTPEDVQPTTTVTIGDNKTETVVTSNPSENATTSEDTQPSGSSTNYTDSTESDQSAPTNDSSVSNSTTSNQSEQQVVQDNSSSESSETTSNQPDQQVDQDDSSSESNTTTSNQSDQQVDQDDSSSEPNSTTSNQPTTNEGQDKDQNIDSQPKDSQPNVDQPKDNQPSETGSNQEQDGNLISAFLDQVLSKIIVGFTEG